jgi:hypothetical protein
VFNIGNTVWEKLVFGLQVVATAFAVSEPFEHAKPIIVMEMIVKTI